MTRQTTFEVAAGIAQRLNLSPEATAQIRVELDKTFAEGMAYRWGPLPVEFQELVDAYFRTDGANNAKWVLLPLVVANQLLEAFEARAEDSGAVASLPANIVPCALCHGTGKSCSLEECPCACRPCNGVGFVRAGAQAAPTQAEG